jgi:hypothetical protein
MDPCFGEATLVETFRVRCQRSCLDKPSGEKELKMPVIACFPGKVQLLL